MFNRHPFMKRYIVVMGFIFPQSDEPEDVHVLKRTKKGWKVAYRITDMLLDIEKYDRVIIDSDLTSQNFYQSNQKERNHEQESQTKIPG